MLAVKPGSLAEGGTNWRGLVPTDIDYDLETRDSADTCIIAGVLF